MKTKPAVSVSRASLWHIPLAFLVAMALVPVLFALLYSFKSLQSIYGDAGLFTSGFTLDNYRDIARQLPIVQITLNTLTVAVLVTACKLLTSILAAYAFVFTSFRGKTVLYFLLISTIFIPFTVTMIPNYITVSKLNLFDSVLGIVLPQLADATGIFLLRQFFMSLPKELSEAAIIDGCGHVRIFTRIMLPLSKSAISALVIFTFIKVWNDYLAPLIYLQTPEKRTVQLGLSLFRSQYSMEYSVVMAGTVCALLPILILYFCCEKQITEGIAFSGMKN